MFQTYTSIRFLDERLMQWGLIPLPRFMYVYINKLFKSMHNLFLLTQDCYKIRFTTNLNMSWCKNV